MKTKMNLSTRFTTLSILPEKGNVMDMLMKRQIIKIIDITPEEVEKYQIHNDNENIKWSGETYDSIPEFEFNKEQVSFLKKLFTELDNNNQITDNILDFAVVILNSNED